MEKEVTWHLYNIRLDFTKVKKVNFGLFETIKAGLTGYHEKPIASGREHLT